jgi:hypothetical protein
MISPEGESENFHHDAKLTKELITKIDSNSAAPEAGDRPPGRAG